nr:4-aminobutyrate aminotransferase PuuE [Candidatus Pantoea persica]
MRSLYADHLLAHLQFLPRGSLQQRLLICMRNAIREGVFPGGSRLPATRDLSLSRNNVVSVY